MAVHHASFAHFRPTPGEHVSLPFDELPALAGRRFFGDWLAVEAERVEQFEWATYLRDSPHPLGGSLYPEGMIEGLHLLGVLDYMMNRILYLEGPSAFGWNYGFDRVRFVSTIHVGQRMRLTGAIGRVQPKDSGFLVRQDIVVEVENRDRPGFVADWWVYWLRDAPCHG